MYTRAHQIMLYHDTHIDFSSTCDYLRYMKVEDFINTGNMVVITQSNTQSNRAGNNSVILFFFKCTSKSHQSKTQKKTKC